jgi:tetratricopeptide (TPR) repeat protein
VDTAALIDRAARMHAAGMAASDNGQPATAVRRLRAGLRLIDEADAAGSARGGAGNGAGTARDADLLEVRGRLLISLAWAESERGRVEAAFRLLDEAEPNVSDRQRPVLLAQRALLLKRTGRNEAALRQYDQAVALLSDQANALDLLRALNNRSLVHLDAGRVRPARTDLQRCAQIAASEGLELYAATTRVNLGCLDVLAGDLPAALGAFAAAREEYERLAPGRLPNLAVERARALVAAGLFADADRELAYAIEHATEQRLSHTYADALQVRAEAALLAGRPRAAAQWARQARQRFLGRDNARRAELATLLELRARDAAGVEQVAGIGREGQRLAVRLRRLGLAEDARVAALVAARAWVRAGRGRHAGRIAGRYGPPGRTDRLDTRLLWRLTRAELASPELAGAQLAGPAPNGAEPESAKPESAKPESAEPDPAPRNGAGRDGGAAGRARAGRHLLAGMAALHGHRTQFGCLDLQTGASVHGQDLARAGLAAALANGAPAAIYRWSERARAQALLLPPVRPPADPVAAGALEELRQCRYALHAAELAGRPAGGLRARIEALQRTVRERTWSTPGQRAATGPAVAPFTAVRRELGHAALVTYLSSGSALFALVVVDGRAVVVPLGERAAAEEAVLRLRADLDAQAGRALPGRLAAAVAAATARDAGALAALVLDPLLASVGDRDLVVVPTGILVTVPWSVLPGCAERPVTVAPSATAWLAARRRLRGEQPPAGPGRRPLLVAGPGNARGDAEVHTIAALYPHATVLTGPEATPAATLAALGDAGLAHVAAHGHHRAENPLFSALDLAGGPLLGYDLQGVARTPAMVVLSSCELGLTDVRPGDETFGMATALLAAGSSTVVASVTRVADEAAMGVMTRFHRGVAAGRSPATALAAAMPPGQTAGFVCLGAG